MNIPKKIYGLVFCLGTIAISIGCSKSSDTDSSTTTIGDSTSNMSQTAMAEVNSQASASESASAVGFISEENQFDNSVHTLSACNFSTARTSCSSSADTIAWNGCTVDSAAATMTGGWTETFSGTSAGSCTVPVVSGETVVRTTTSSVLSGGGAYGGSITTDTSGGTTYDGTVLPSTGTSVVNSSGTRTITIHGTHKVGKTTGGVTIFEHYLNTPTPLTVTGTRAGGNRTIASGTVKVFHNLAKYQASLSFSGVTWGSSSCCYPTSGSITGTLSGTQTGTTTMTFSTTCGAASYVDESGSSGTVTLSQCNQFCETQILLLCVMGSTHST